MLFRSKSDDIRGRLKTYERIVKGLNLTDPGVPESFRVLVKELQGLGLDVEIAYEDGTLGELLLEEDDEPVSSPRTRPREEKREGKVLNMDDVFEDIFPEELSKGGEQEPVFSVLEVDSDNDPEEGADE